MATFPASGQASTADFIDTFGAPAAGNTNQMYRGGSYVPDISANNSVPTSGAADSADYYGTTDYVPMSGASLTTTSITLKSASTGAVTLVTDLVGANVSGGTQNYTYTWELVSGQALTVSGQGFESVTFNRSATGVITSSVYRCKITDGVGTIYTNNVTINLYHYHLRPETLVEGTTYTSYAPGGQGTARIRLEFRRDGTWRAYDVYDIVVLASGDWVAPKSSTVGDDFDLLVNDDDTGISGANTNFDGYNIAKGTAAELNTTRGGEETNFLQGSIRVAGIRSRIRCQSGGAGYVYDVRSIGLRASVGTASMGSLL